MSRTSDELRAPGKLFIAGEYAIVEPGGRAVLVAVDRYVTAHITASETGSVSSAHYGPEPVYWDRDETAAVVVANPGRPLDQVFATIRTVEAYAGDLDIEPRGHCLQITSELQDPTGRKYGLGSSAAVTVAVVRALDEFYGLRLSLMEQFKLSLLATLDVAPAASGGDLAASTFGGWLAYRSPDRVAAAALRMRAGVLAAVRQPWPLLEITPLPAPTSLDLIVGWTGQSASTTALVDDVHARREAPNLSYDQFLAGSEAQVADLITGLRHDDSALVLDAVRGARELLAGLGAGTGIDIETPALAHLVRSAEQIGAAGKSSGAGGGDCGIVLAPRGTDLGSMLASWGRAGLQHLPVAATAAPQQHQLPRLDPAAQ